MSLSNPSITRLHTPDEAAAWLQGLHAARLQTDSRHLHPHEAFIAWPGAAHDARRYVLQALQNGAAACLVEAHGAEAFDFMQGDALTADEARRLALYPGLRADTGEIAAAFYGRPSQALDVIAATGTNGKTSTAWWLAQAFAQLNPAGAGLVGTLGVGCFVGGQASVQPTGLTTPDPVVLQHHLRQWVDRGVKVCAMEASSIGIAEHRLSGTQVHTAVFTNFTQDHLDYHGSMAAYWQAKRRLFAWPGLRAAVINIDDAQGLQLARELQQSAQRDDLDALDIWTLSAQPAGAVPDAFEARLRAVDIEYGDAGLAFTVQEQGGKGNEGVRLQTQLIGQYNINNLLGVLACLRQHGVPLQQAADLCAGLQPVPGRMQRLHQSGQPLVVVDYAHTPDALEKALLGLQPQARSRQGRLWCVFGCGGNRDAAKRPLMGAVAARLADVPFITSDNPRNEEPTAIIEQIRAGMPADVPALQMDEDRARAIATAVTQAAANDVILLAGKGHEDYQEVRGEKRPFADMAHAQAALAQRAKEQA